jgi:hypothetical protein
MPYTSLATLVDGQILSASWLNGLSANQAFMFGVANVPNVPFNSYTATTLNNTTMVWYIRHRLSYLHWQIKSDAAFDYARVYYNGVKVGEIVGGTLWNGTYNLTTWAGLPNLRGAWVTATAYDDNTNGDGDVVTQGGQYYRCKLAHTSASGNQPGVGGSWATNWDLLTLPGLGTMCQVWANVSNSASIAKSVDYILETDSVSF